MKEWGRGAQASGGPRPGQQRKGRCFSCVTSGRVASDEQRRGGRGNKQVIKEKRRESQLQGGGKSERSELRATLVFIISRDGTSVCRGMEKAALFICSPPDALFHQISFMSDGRSVWSRIQEPTAAIGARILCCGPEMAGKGIGTNRERNRTTGGQK